LFLGVASFQLSSRWLFCGENSHSPFMAAGNGNRETDAAALVFLSRQFLLRGQVFLGDFPI
jgi:hypothetical protein